MYSPVHAAAGLLLAQAAPNPIVAFGIGVASHYALDHLPHGDTHMGGWFFAKVSRFAVVEIFDLGGAAILVWWLVSRLPEPNLPTLLAGAVGGITPDVLWGTRYLERWIIWLPKSLKRFLDWHARWHERAHGNPNDDLPLGAGLLLQAILILAVVLVYR